MTLGMTPFQAWLQLPSGGPLWSTWEAPWAHQGPPQQYDYEKVGYETHLPILWPAVLGCQPMCVPRGGNIPNRRHGQLLEGAPLCLGHHLCPQAATGKWGSLTRNATNKSAVQTVVGNDSMTPI